MPDDLRAIDAEIAERLFGWPPARVEDGVAIGYLPLYSSSPDAEAQVIEAMAKRGWTICVRKRNPLLTGPEGYINMTRFVRHTGPDTATHVADGVTSPLATARAALAALESEVYASSSTVRSTDPPARPLTDEEREPPYRAKEKPNV